MGGYVGQSWCHLAACAKSLPLVFGFCCLAGSVPHLSLLWFRSLYGWRHLPLAARTVALLALRAHCHCCSPSLVMVTFGVRRVCLHICIHIISRLWQSWSQAFLLIWLFRLAHFCGTPSPCVPFHKLRLCLLHQSSQCLSAFTLSRWDLARSLWSDCV